MKHFFYNFPNNIHKTKKNIYTEQVTPSPPKKLYGIIGSTFSRIFPGRRLPNRHLTGPNRWLRRARCAMLVPLISQRASGLAWSWMMQGAKTMGACHLEALGMKISEKSGKNGPQLWEFSKGHLHFFQEHLGW